MVPRYVPVYPTYLPGYLGRRYLVNEFAVVAAKVPSMLEVHCNFLLGVC